MDEVVVTEEDLKVSTGLRTLIRTTSLPPVPVGRAKEAPHGPISPNILTPTLTVEVLTTVNREEPRVSHHRVLRDYIRVTAVPTRTVHIPERVPSLDRVLMEDSVPVVHKVVMASLRDRTPLE